MNLNGVVLETLLGETSLNIMSDGTPARYSLTGKGSVLDLFLMNSDIFTNFKVRVNYSTCGSDHHVVEMSMCIFFMLHIKQK